MRCSNPTRATLGGFEQLSGQGHEAAPVEKSGQFVGKGRADQIAVQLVAFDGVVDGPEQQSAIENALQNEILSPFAHGHGGKEGQNSAELPLFPCILPTGSVDTRMPLSCKSLI